MTFGSIFRKILFRCGATPSTSGNVVPLDGTELLSLEDDGDGDNEEMNIEDPLPTVSLYLDDTIFYISGWIARKLQRRFGTYLPTADPK